MATAFSTQGATPFSTGISQTTPQIATTPVAKALNGATTPFNGGSTPNGSFSNASNFESITGQKSYVPPPPIPSTPLKSTTTNNVDGSSTTHTYHAPETGMLTDNSGGTSNPNKDYNAGVTQQQASQGTPVAPTNPTPQTPTLPQNNLNTATTGLLNTAQGNTTLGQAGNAVTQKYEGLINPILKGTIGQEIGDRSTGTTQVGEGNAQLAAAAGGALIQGLTNQEQQELAGTGQALTGQSQQASALNAAGGLSTPSNQFLSTSYGNQVLDSNGQPVAGTGGQLQTAVQNAINQIKAGGGYNAANSTLSSFGPAGTNALLTALGPGFNINANNAEAAAQAANIGTQQTLNTNIGATGAQQATQNYVAAKTSYDTASQQATNLQNTLSTTGINQNPQFINQKINALQNQLGSANYASFITALNETKQAYTSLLSSVGASTPTVNGQQATDIFNENSTPAQINAAIDALNTASYAKLKPLYDQIGTYSNIGSSGSGGSTANPWH